MFAAERIHELPVSERYLGPGRVVTTGADGVTLELPDGMRIAAVVALAVPYEPAIGDELLLIGENGRYYVIGVLRGTGKTRLAVPGDIDVHAVDGKLRLHGDRGVHVEGDEVAIHGRSLRMHVDAVRQKFNTLYRHVRGLCSTRAGKSHALTDETAHAQARRTVILSEETVTVNGRRIQIG